MAILIGLAVALQRARKFAVLPLYKATSYNPAAYEHTESDYDRIKFPSSSEDSKQSQSFITAASESQALYTPVTFEHTSPEYSGDDQSYSTVGCDYRAFHTPAASEHPGSKDNRSAVEATGDSSRDQDCLSDIPVVALSQDTCLIKRSGSKRLGSFIPNSNASSQLSAQNFQLLTKMSGPMTGIGDTKVMDWVEQQALGDGIDSIASDVNKLVCQSQIPNPNGRVYDIQTLLDMCSTVDLSHIHLRIHHGALHENIFKTTKVMQASARHVRSRGLSELSRPSIASDEEDVLLVGQLSHPVRQPNPPPQSIEAQRRGFRHMPVRRPRQAPPNMVAARVEGFLTFPQRVPLRRPISPPPDLAQQHAGFQRFLKEHASPPHHRVTAGGRIVPANGPPPAFNVNSLTGAIMSPSRQATSTVPHAAKSNEASQAFQNDPEPRFISAASRHGIVVSEASEQTSNTKRPARHERKTSQVLQQDGNHQIQESMPIQHPLNAAPVMLLQDGTTFVMQGGLPYRVHSNGFQPLTETVPLLFSQQNAMPGFSNASLFQPSILPQPNYTLPYTPVQNTTLVNSEPMPNSSLLHSGSSEQALQQQHAYLRNELQGLDRYIALSGKRAGRHDHLAFVALRRQLVQEIDRYRRHLSRTSSSEAPSQVYQYTSLGARPRAGRYTSQTDVPNGNDSMGTAQSQPAHNHEPRTSMPLNPHGDITNPPKSAATSVGGVLVPQLKTPSVKSMVGNSKVLSPEAPEFVPEKFRPSSARTVESCISNGEDNDAILKSWAVSSSKGTISPITDRPMPSQVRNNGENTYAKDSPSRAVADSQDRLAHARYGTSGSWSAVEALPSEVHEQDIAYVNELGLNPVYGPKRFCSTIPEFQEIIRRVREQARLYGCKGGSSKDPEFDAEQDIRWAISDLTPIPLPKKIPDHIAYPRPWCWNDSAFNVRADRYGVRNIRSTGNQQTTNGSLVNSVEVDSSSNVTTKSCETTPRTNRHTTRLSPAAESGSRAHANLPADDSSFSSSIQAAILRETRDVLGNIPSNTLLSNAGADGYLGRPKFGEASPGKFRADGATAKDPFRSTESTMATERELASEGMSTRSETMNSGEGSPQPPKFIVKLPDAWPSGESFIASDQYPQNKTHVGDHNTSGSMQHQSNSTTSSTRFGTPTFLGKLLKSPLFSSANIGQEGSNKQTSNPSASQALGMMNMTRKENLRSAKGAYSLGYPISAGHAGTIPRQGYKQDYNFGKTRSSVAPTNAYAHAQMHPQTGSSGGSFQSSKWQIRHHPPSPAYSSHSVIDGTKSNSGQQRGMPQYDGADDDFPRRTKEPENVDTKAKRDELDPMTFQTASNGIPGGHEYGVNRFLDKLKKAESKDKAKHPSKSPK